MNLHIAAALIGAFSLAGCMTAAEQQTEARAVAMRDDSTCRGYGAKPGSQVYVQCRMNISNQRGAAERQEAANDTAIGTALILNPPFSQRGCLPNC
jgi:hypothetical protein